jgi:hypothetical protein
MAARDYIIVSPDGRELTITGPDNATPQQLRAAAEAAFKASVPAPVVMPENAAKPALDGIKNAAAGAVRGAGSIGATLMAPIDAGARALGVQNDFVGRTDRREAMDSALRELVGADPDSIAYKGGKLGSEIAGTLGVGSALAGGAAAARVAPSLVNAIRTSGMTAGAPASLATRAAGGAISGGASAALVNPDDIASGAAIGAAAPGLVRGAGAVGGALGVLMARGGVNNPELANAAINKYGIPLGMADVSDSGMAKAARTILNDAPIIGRVGDRQKEAVQEAYNAAVGGTFGAKAPKLTPAVMDAAKKRMGGEFDRLWGQNSLIVDAPFMQTIQDLQARASKLPKAEGDSLAAEVNDLLSRATPGPSGAPMIPGDVANAFQQHLRRRSEGSASLKNELGDLRQSIFGAFSRSVAPADAQALTAVRGQYKAFKTVKPLLEGAEAGVAGRAPGDVPAGLLPQAVRTSYSDGVAGSPLAELSQIGSQYVTDRVARTGGSNRAMLQNSALGALLGLGGYTNPAMAVATLPAAYGLQRYLGSPTAAASMVRRATSPAVGQNTALEQLLYRSAPAISAD